MNISMVQAYKNNPYHFAERLLRILAPEKEPTTALQQKSEILDIGPREVVQTHFEHM